MVAVSVEGHDARQYGRTPKSFREKHNRSARDAFQDAQGWPVLACDRQGVRDKGFIHDPAAWEYPGTDLAAGGRVRASWFHTADKSLGIRPYRDSRDNGHHNDHSGTRSPCECSSNFPCFPKNSIDDGVSTRDRNRTSWKRRHLTQRHG